jgi:membrane-associated PAP2 superfamily phosphatase
MFNLIKQRLEIGFFQKSLLWLAISLIVILLIGQLTDLDLIIEDYYYDAKLGIFPWDKTWFAHYFMHEHVKAVIIRSGQFIILIMLIDALKPWSKISEFMRVRLRFLAIASLLVPAAVRTVKQFSVLHCPFEIDRYGGDSPFIRLLDSFPALVKNGHCFPAGHATTGLWLAAICVFWLPHDTSKATKMFFMGLSIGIILGWVQQMRGHHFLFHTLWSSWIAALVIVIMLLVFSHKIFDHKPQLQQK